MEHCDVRSRLSLRISAATNLINDMLEQRKTDKANPALIAQLAAARRIGREAVQAFEQHCREHGCEEAAPVNAKAFSRRA